MTASNIVNNSSGNSSVFSVPFDYPHYSEYVSVDLFDENTFFIKTSLDRYCSLLQKYCLPRLVKYYRQTILNNMLTSGAMYCLKNEWKPVALQVARSLAFECLSASFRLALLSYTTAKSRFCVEQACADFALSDQERELLFACAGFSVHKH